METPHPPAEDRSRPSALNQLLRRCVVVFLLAAALVPLDPSAGPAAAAGSVPATSVDEVASEGAEPVLTLVPDLWAPATGATVRWAVQVENLAVAAAAAGSPRVWLAADDGLSLDEVEGPLPAGWNVDVLTPSSVQVTVGEDLAPGETAELVVRSTVTAGSGEEVGLDGGVSSGSQWVDTPRAGSYADVVLVVDGAELSGTVAAEGAGSPLRSVCIDIETDDGGQWYRGTTRGDGTWNVSVRTGEQYRVRVDPGCQSVYGSGAVTEHAAAWYPGVVSGGDAQLVRPPDDGPDLGTIELGPGGAVSGTVTVPDGSDPTDVWVSIDGAESGWWTAGSTPAADGTYLVQAIPAGAHVARFQDNDGILAEHYFDGASQRDAATPFDVSAGSVTTGIDGAMVPGAAIAGVVTDDATGEPLDGIAVVVRDPDGDWVASSTTRADGSYSVPGLAEGSYRVRFEDDEGTYLWVFHDGAWTWDASEPEFLAAGSTWQLDAALSVGSTVSGRVSAAVAANGLDAGDPIAGVAVLAWSAPLDFDADPVAFAITDENGDYVLNGLPPIGVDVLFIHGLPSDDDGGDGGEFPDVEWAAQFWQGANHPSDATALDMSDGPALRAGVDAALAPAPVISGRVLDADGGSLAGATGVGQMAVGLFVPGDDEPLVVAFTGPDGSFEIRSPFVGLETHLLTIDITDAHAGAFPPLWFGNVAAELGEDFTIDPVADGAAVLVVPAAGLSDVHLTYDPPDPPPSVVAPVVTVEGVDLVVTWSPVAGVVDHYAVLVDGVEVARVSADELGASGTAGVGASDQPRFRVVVSDLVQGRRYRVSVVAGNLGGDSEPVPVSVTVGAAAGSGPAEDEPDGAAPGGGQVPEESGPGDGTATPAPTNGPSAAPAGAASPTPGEVVPRRLALTGNGVAGLVAAGLGLVLLGGALGRTRRTRTA